MAREITNIVLIGMPTAGKTTLSKLLASSLNYNLLSMDASIEEKEGISIPDIFSMHGEEYFRSVESEIALEASKMEKTVIDCGGGVVLKEENMDVLRRTGVVVWLDRDVDLLFPSDDRPLSKSPEEIKKLYDQRKDLYRKYSDIVVSNNDEIEDTLNEIVEKIKEWL